MRCVCCNRNLNDYESTLKGAKSKDYLDMCRTCLKDLDIEVLPNTKEPDEEVIEDEHYWEFPEVEINHVEWDDYEL